MANNQYTNHVIIDGVVRIDLRSDTVTADDILSGITAHIASGATVSGTIVNGDSIGYGSSTQPLVGTAIVGATKI